MLVVRNSQRPTQKRLTFFITLEAFNQYPPDFVNFSEIYLGTFLCDRFLFVTFPWQPNFEKHVHKAFI